MTEINPSKWVQESQRSLSAEAEAALLTELLSAGPEHLIALGKVATNRLGRTLVRCAAIDQCARHLGSNAQGFLEKLCDPKQEANEDVRYVAYQWLAHIQAADTVRGVEAAWRQRVTGDPSPRVRWLASLDS